MPFSAKQYDIESPSSETEGMCASIQCKLNGMFFSTYSGVHSSHFFPIMLRMALAPRARYSTDLLARLLGTVSRILRRLCAPAVIRHASAKENISCLVWLSARERDVPCGLTEGLMLQ